MFMLYKIVDIFYIDILIIGIQLYGDLEVEVVDSIVDYVEMFKDIFDFELIKKFFNIYFDFKVFFDGFFGVIGLYGKVIF